MIEAEMAGNKWKSVFYAGVGKKKKRLGLVDN